jgi:hypothetical protein
MLKQEVQDYPIAGGTPMAPAMNKALTGENAKELQNPLPGSQAVLITDGSPGDQRQKDEILTDKLGPGLVGQFSARCLPINVFALRTDADPTAAPFLKQIAGRTGGTFTQVESGEELAGSIIGLYARWKQLRFEQYQKNADGTYHIPVDRLAQQVTIITFASDGTHFGGIKVGDLAIQTREPFADRHYEVTNVDIQPVPIGTYMVDMGGDTDAQVYALVDLNLQVGITRPVNGATLYTGRVIEIDVSLFNGPGRRFPVTNAAGLKAVVTYTPGGQQPIQTIVNNFQQQKTLDGDNFVGYTPRFDQPGQMTITVEVSYDDIPLKSGAVTVSLVPPPVVCKDVACVVHENLLLLSLLLTLLVILLLLLVAWLLWKRQPAPFGTLHNVPPGRRQRRDQASEDFSVPLNAWRNKRLNRSMIASRDIQEYPGAAGRLHLDGINFLLVTKRSKSADAATGKDKVLYLHKLPGGGSLEIKRQAASASIKVDVGQDVPLQNEDILHAHGEDIAQFSLR